MPEPKEYTLADGSKRYLIQYRDDRRRLTTKRGFKNKRDARRWWAETQLSLERGEYVSATAGKTSVGELGPLWLEGKRGTLTPTSWRPLESAWRLHVEPAWGQVSVSTIRKPAIQEWITRLSRGEEGKKPLSPTMVTRCLEVLRGCLGIAVENRQLNTNPALGVALPQKISKPHIYLSHADIRALAEESPYPLLVYILAYTGLRWSEAISLKVRHVDLEKRRISVQENVVIIGRHADRNPPKSRQYRQVPILEYLLPLLEAAMRDKSRESLLLPGEGGGYMQRSHHKAGWFEKAVRAAGIPRVTPHDLRHSAASFAVSAGANVKVVQRMLGHANAAMTLDRYADLFEDDLTRTAGAIDAAILEAM